jgi:hypothetical protein
VPSVHQSSDDPGFGQGLAPGFAVVSLVGINRLLVALDQSVGGQAIADIGAGEDGAADQIGPLIDGQMRLVPEEAPLPTPGEPSVGVPLRDLAFLPRRSFDVGLDQARVDQRAALDEQALAAS